MKSYIEELKWNFQNSRQTEAEFTCYKIFYIINSGRTFIFVKNGKLVNSFGSKTSSEAFAEAYRILQSPMAKMTN